ncbi:MAG: GAF domain-containing protein [Xenococcaceae cyanobacterium]
MNHESYNNGDRAKSKQDREGAASQRRIDSHASFNPIEERSSNFLLQPGKIEEEILNKSNTELGRDSEDNSLLKLSPKPLNLKIATALVTFAVMLPILALGTVTYHFGNKAINRQAVIARKIDETGISEQELAIEKQLLANLLIGSGVTALITGILAGYLTNRTLQAKIKQNTIIVKPKNEPKKDEGHKSLAKFLDYLNQSADRENILINTVKEAQRLLKCDRVVIYRFDHSSNGEVIAEAVAPGWIEAIGMNIEDSCFEANYREKYRDGKVKIINDIDNANLDPCYVAKLKKLEIKANLVTPIIHQERLFGLLAAHQCANPHFWQPDEVELLTRLAQRVSVVLDQTQLLTESKLFQEKAKTETNWIEYFTDAVKHIREPLQSQDLLDVSVEEVRRVLKCDRVLIYSLNQDDYGIVIAESVAPGWTRALGMILDDPCFEARYLEQYQNGRVRALDNIYEGEIIACYLEQLEKLEVKANLVAPINREGKLFGLLVAHQCDSPRHWLKTEIAWVSQIATQVGFALDNVLLHAQLIIKSSQLKQQQNTEIQWTNFFIDAVNHIRRSLKQKDVIDISVKEVRRVLDCDRVLIYSLNQNKYGIVIAESVAPRWTKALGMTIQDPCFEARYLEQYKNGRVRALDNIYEAGITTCYLEQLEKLEVKANLVIPIISEDKLFGLLVAHQCANPRVWQQHEICWLTQIATQVGFALDNAKLLAESSQLKQKAKIKTQWIQLFDNAVKNIRNSLQQQDILEVSVEEVKKILECDRVVIYSLGEDNRGLVIAESVAPGWTRALGMTIQDPCFEAKYLEQYKNGRVKALNNVDRAEINPRYLEQLKKLEVKANIVTPILREDKLFGLLVAHNCSDVRTWKQQEIIWVTQIATQVGFALAHAELLRKLETNNLPPTSSPKSNLTSTEGTITQDKVSGMPGSQEQKPTAKITKPIKALSKLLLHIEKGFETLRLKVNQQSKRIAQFLLQMKKVANFTEELITLEQSSPSYLANAQLESSSTARETNTNTTSRINLIKIEATIIQSAREIKRIHYLAEQLEQIGDIIDDLRQQVERQTTNISTQNNRLEQNEQNSLLLISKRVKPLSGRLTTQTTQIEALVSQISIEIKEIIDLLDLNEENSSEEIPRERTNSFWSNNPFDTKVNALTGKITQVIEQAQNLAVVNQFLLQISNRASQFYTSS